MGDASAFNYIAMKEAVADAGFEPDEISDPRIGLIAGSGGDKSLAMAVSR